MLILLFIKLNMNSKKCCGICGTKFLLKDLKQHFNSTDCQIQHYQKSQDWFPGYLTYHEEIEMNIHTELLMDMIALSMDDNWHPFESKIIKESIISYNRNLKREINKQH